ncbi:hypothetical protein [Streptomyces olivaceus]|uniref:hypothetical protein n=1 Tax=Streptomyces olivaceus TaxID=47716 RepID=UPI0022EEF261|nr:hypothetical protein [Streptomyces olivaceus]GHI91763.1 hypothetical protein TPA0905_12340 [Streptomyces olivaceus]
MSGYRCTAVTEAQAGIQVLAESIGSPLDAIEWASDEVLQCLIEDIPHDHHAAFLRTGARQDSDVFLRWTDGSSEQDLADLTCCLAYPDPMGSACTIYAGHPGKCEWAYIDPPYVAATARADQILKELGLQQAPGRQPGG